MLSTIMLVTKNSTITVKEEPRAVSQEEVKTIRLPHLAVDVSTKIEPRPIMARDAMITQFTSQDVVIAVGGVAPFEYGKVQDMLLAIHQTHSGTELIRYYVKVGSAANTSELAQVLARHNTGTDWATHSMRVEPQLEPPALQIYCYDLEEEFTVEATQGPGNEHLADGQISVEYSERFMTYTTRAFSLQVPVILLTLGSRD